MQEQLGFERSPLTSGASLRAGRIASSPTLSPPGLGRTRRQRDLGRGHRRARRAGRNARPAGRRHRHHRPARDRRGVVAPTGEPRHRAIVWQDRRTAARCDELRDAGHLPLVRERTGLVLDPYFSGSKIEWLLTEGGVAADADLAVGTIDSWLMWKLTSGAVHATEVSNAAHDALRHPHAVVVRRAVRPVRRTDARAARGAAVVGPVRRGRVRARRPRRRADRRRRRRPAGRAVRPGVRRTRG